MLGITIDKHRYDDNESQDFSGPRKSFGGSSYGGNENRTFGGSSSIERPSSYGNEKRSFGGNSFGGNEKRSYGGNSSFGEKRSFEKRSFNRDDKKSDFRRDSKFAPFKSDFKKGFKSFKDDADWSSTFGRQKSE